MSADTTTIEGTSVPSAADRNSAVDLPPGDKRPEAFAGRVIGDFTGLATSLMAAIGDRLGLFRMLARGGPATSAELAAHAQVHERYAREWLTAMATAGYLDYDATSGCFSLPPAHAAVLADEGGPLFLGGGYQQWLGLVRVLDEVSRAFQTGGGVPYDAYGPDFWDGTERFTAGWFDHLLVQQWLPAVPEVKATFERGALVADVGCGHGRALIRLAQAFPTSWFVGYDMHAPSVARASAAAGAAGVADRVRFERRDVSEGLTEQYDVITAFDVVHDTIAPRALLRAIRGALRPGGTFLCLEFNSSERLEDEIGNPLATLGLTVSTLFCMTTSLAYGGEGLGARGLHERKLRELCADAGFAEVRRAPVDIPFNVLYVITA